MEIRIMLKKTFLQKITLERRLVVYKGYVEASKVPQSWNAWLHHVIDDVFQLLIKISLNGLRTIHQI